MAMPQWSRERPYDNFHRRPSASGNSPINHSRRYWVDDGDTPFMMANRSDTSPFGTLGGSANDIFDDLFSMGTPRRNTHAFIGGGLFRGTAADLLGDFFSGPHFSIPTQNRGPHRWIHVEDLNREPDMDVEGDDEQYDYRRGNNSRHPWMEDEDEDEQYDYLRGSNSRRSPFPNFNSREAENRRSQKMQSGRRPSPRRSSNRDYPHSRAQPPREVFVDEDDEYGEYDNRHQRPHTSRNNSSDEDMIEALEAVVEHQTNEVRRCKRELERALRQRQVRSEYLQALLNELKADETALANAVSNLQSARDAAGWRHQQRSSTYRPQPSQRRRSSGGMAEDFEDPFPDMGFGKSTRRSQPVNTLFDEFVRMHNTDPFGPFGNTHRNFSAFGGVPPFNGFFAVPNSTHTKRPRFTQTNNRQQPPPAPGYGRFRTAASRPPPTVLTPDEAKRLYKMYSDRWDALSPMDPDIPYPARGLHGQALLARDTIWAPNVSSHPLTWSDEMVMQANVQAFFLNVVDLPLQYTQAPGAGKVQMGFDKTRASPAQVKQLIDILKKEKARWHSDRLGRRNGGASGANEELQSDERARAVFHAVCELMETAQE